MSVLLAIARTRETLANPFARTYKRDADGKFGSGGGSMHDEANAHAAFDFDDEKTGMSARVSEIRAGAGGQRYVDVELRNAQGDPCGAATRTISSDGKTVSHSGMMLYQNFGGAQGQGFATRFNAQAEGVYRQTGVEKITLSASSSVGGYAWARAGYDFNGMTSRQDIARRAQSKAQGYDEPTRAAIAKVAGNPNSTPIEFAMIGHTPGASTWAGKEIMMGSVWEGVKHLD